MLPIIWLDIREPTYVLDYLIGMQEIEAIRAEYIAIHSEPEPPSEFYDRLLRIGSIPPAKHFPMTMIHFSGNHVRD